MCAQIHNHTSDVAVIVNLNLYMHEFIVSTAVQCTLNSIVQLYLIYVLLIFNVGCMLHGDINELEDPENNFGRRVDCIHGFLELHAGLQVLAV